MDLTYEVLEARLAELSAMKQQAVIHLAAVDGAVQECHNMIALLSKPPKPEDE